MDKFYTMEIAGLTRNLPICPLNEKLSIAGFIMFSDVELTVKCAEELLAKVPEFDYLITAEAKGIPLAYEMSRQSGKKYLVARKKMKAYMVDPVEVNVQSITTAGVQTLFMDKEELELMKGKRILIVDDVISTGGSLLSLENLVAQAGGEIVGKMTILAEGDAIGREDITYLAPLPLFDKNGQPL